MWPGPLYEDWGVGAHHEPVRQRPAAVGVWIPVRPAECLLGVGTQLLVPLFLRGIRPLPSALVVGLSVQKFRPYQPFIKHYLPDALQVGKVVQVRFLPGQEPVASVAEEGIVSKVKKRWSVRRCRPQ